MAKHPDTRPQSAEAVAAELEAIEDGMSVPRVQVVALPALAEVPTGPGPWADIDVTEPDEFESDEDEDEPVSRGASKARTRMASPIAETRRDRSGWRDGPAPRRPRALEVLPQLTAVSRPRRPDLYGGRAKEAPGGAAEMCHLAGPVSGPVTAFAASSSHLPFPPRDRSVY